MEVRLPVSTKAKLARHMLVQQERGFPRVLYDLGERRTLNSKPVSSARQRQTPVCPEFLLQLTVQCSGDHELLLISHSLHPGSFACSWLVFVSGSLLEPACGSCTATGHVAARAASLCSLRRALEHIAQCITAWASTSERFPSGGHGPRSLSR